MDKELHRETLEQTLCRDVYDMVNLCNKENKCDIESWVEHIKYTFGMYNYRRIDLPDMSDEEIFGVLVEYSIELCESNPIKEWNRTEAIRRVIQAYKTKLGG